MSNQINEGAARYKTDTTSHSHEAGDRPVRSAAQRKQSPQQLVTDHLDLWASTVTPKSTSGRGSNSKIQLTGIKKLRELILELAVRGKLVAQNPDDEPASKLLERIEAEKAQLIKGGKLKKQKPLAQVSEDEKPFELPEGWEWVRLGHIAQINPRNQVDDSTQVSFIPMASVSTRYSGSHDQEIKSWSEIKTGFTHFADGDVAIAKITPCFENSKAAIFSNLSNGVGAGTTELHVARPYGFLEQRFVLLVFKSPRYLIEGESQMTGSAGQKRVPKSYFEGTPIQLPPLTEQQRIVAKVDELMALCDQLEQQSEHQLSAHQQLTDTLLGTLLQPAAGALTESADATTKSSQKEQLNDNWQRLANHFDLLFSGPMGAWAIDRLKDTILQLAVMGKLVPQNPDDEPASKLLERIEEEKARLVKEGKIKKPKKLPPVSDEEKPFELPEGWEWSFWDNIALKIGDIDHKMPAAEKTGYPYISPRDFQGSNSINFENAKKISRKDFLTLSRKIIPERGDIIFPRYGTIGDNRLVNTDIEFLASYSCCVIKTLRGFINADYQFITSISKTIKDQTDSAVNKTTQPNVGIKSIQLFLMPIPPLAEQQHIVEKVDELFALCDKLKERLQQASETEQHLTNAIVEQALS